MTRRRYAGQLVVTTVLVACTTGLVGAGDTLIFSHQIGCAGRDVVRDVATDRNGNIYVAGATDSAHFPLTPKAFDTQLNIGPTLEPDVFVMKLDPQGRTVWSTLVGGPNYDRAYGVEVDRDGYVYVAGRAGAGFPVTPGAVQTTFAGGQQTPLYGAQDGFVCKLAPDGAALVFCTYFGTSDGSIIRDLAVDADGDIYIFSAYSHGSFPDAWFRTALQPTPHGGSDAVIAKLASDGSRVVWATYLGGGHDEGNTGSIRVDATGHAYVLMTTTSPDMPTSPNAYDRTYHGGLDLYVAKLSPDGARLEWGTYLGGTRDESTETHELAIDAAGNAYVASTTQSPDFPTTGGALQRTLGGVNDVFVAKLAADGTRLLASTFLGGSAGELAEGIAVDSAGTVYLTGTTSSDNFPVTLDAFQSRRRGGSDGFVARLAPDLGRLLYATYLGGSDDDALRAAALDGAGSLVVGGSTQSSDWPKRGSPPVVDGHDVDAVIAKLAIAAPP